MDLVTEIVAVRDRTLAALDSTHDYFVHTKSAWDIVRTFVASGHRATIRNVSTGSVLTEAELVGKAESYVAGQLAEATFLQFVAEFEYFYLGLLRAWLTAYPQSLGKNAVELQTILRLPDKDAIVESVVEKEINALLYQKPADWFAYFEARAKLGRPTADEIDRLVEIKATRDVLVHNRGIANAVYSLKAGVLARFPPGVRIEITDDYHRETWNLLRQVVADVCDAAIAKAT